MADSLTLGPYQVEVFPKRLRDPGGICGGDGAENDSDARNAEKRVALSSFHLDFCVYFLIVCRSTLHFLKIAA